MQGSLGLTVRQQLCSVAEEIVGFAGRLAWDLAERQQVTTNLQDVRRLRLDMEPWRDTQAGRALDEQLAAVGSTR